MIVLQAAPSPAARPLDPPQAYAARAYATYEPGLRISTERLRCAMLWLVGASGAIVFGARDVDHGMEPFVLPPGGSTAQLLKDIRPGTGGSDFQSLTAFNGAAFFVVSDGTLTGEGYTEQRPAQPLGVGLGAGQLQK